MYKNLSNNIKKFRNELGLTQKELGKKILKSEISIRKYESGNINIPLSTLFDIAAALKTDIYTLLGDDLDLYSKNNESLLNFPINSSTLKDVMLDHQNFVAKNFEFKSNVEDLKSYGDDWRSVVLEIESNPKFLLNSILKYLEENESFYTTLSIDLYNNKSDDLPYFTDEQINSIVKKVTDLVEYEIYKIEKNFK
ncbi:transcriptional regulator [[Clostridium] sordellii]|uniref:helix-turn-helix transcriptional regulator n=1 Tax=Paraclostridium sordellii TaxID=1505 RepID=UPI0005E9BB64|nr:helix-turn-helix transcriptional regulator [Paeniclostridium sordellii]CEP94661.1 transcriptional regulator [[Clostridium] sordellii] [Paeniclostridium sordellii]